MNVMDVPLKNLAVSDHAMREVRKDEAFDALVESIEKNGVLVPIKVRPAGDKLEVVWGNRRVAAARKAGLTSVPAIVDDLIEEELLVQSYIENDQREDLSDYEKAMALKNLKDVTGWSDETLGKHLSKSRTNVTTLLQLLNEGLVSKAVERPARDVPDLMHKAEFLRRLEKSEGTTSLITPIVKRMVNENLSSREVEALVNQVLDANKFGGSKRAQDVAKAPISQLKEAEATAVRTSKAKTPSTKKPKVGDKSFTWLKDERTIEVEASLREVKDYIATMRKSKHDEQGKKQVLKLWRGILVSMLGEIDRTVSGGPKK